MPNQNAPESPQNRLGAVSPIEGLLFRGSIEDNVRWIWRSVMTGSLGALRGYGELKYKNRLQYIEDKAKIYRWEMNVHIDYDDIDHLVRNCRTIADIDAYFMLLYDYTHFPERFALGKLKLTKGIL